MVMCFLRTGFLAISCTEFASTFVSAVTVVARLNARLRLGGSARIMVDVAAFCARGDRLTAPPG